MLGWFKGRGASRGDRARAQWRDRWHQAAAAADTAQLDPLRAGLDSLGLPDEEVEVEREMLEALQELGELTTAVRQAGLPAIETGHRVVGSERCHFTAPASMPDEAAQPSGRLLLTSGRAIFAGGGRATTISWHRIQDARHADRDLILIRSDREALHRFRCNSFGDALRARFLARELMAASRRP